VTSIEEEGEVIEEGVLEDGPALDADESLDEEAAPDVDSAADDGGPGHAVAAPGLAAGIVPSGMCQLSLLDLEMELPNANPVLVLEERYVPHRLLRIPIGMAEGVAIAYAWRGISTPKPLTHDLWVTMMSAYGMALEVVRITAVEGSAFSGEIVIAGRLGQKTFPCRISDAVALMVRYTLGIPLLATDEVMSKAATFPTV
jgi:uncharacterized protein